MLKKIRQIFNSNREGRKMKGTKFRVLISISLLLILYMSSSFLKASVPVNDPELERFFKSFKHYRFSNVSMYRYEGISEHFEKVKKAVEALSNVKGGGAEVVTDEAVQKACNSLMSSPGADGRNICPEIESMLRGGTECGEIYVQFRNQGIILDQQQFEIACNYYEDMIYKRGTGPVIRHIYVVTSRPEAQGETPREIYTIIVSFSRKDADQLDENLDNSKSDEIFTKYVMKNIDLKPDEFDGATNLYALVEFHLNQGILVNITDVMQGLGYFDFTSRANKITNNLEIDPGNLQSYDLQKYLMVSEGNTYFNDNFNQLTISPDLISWKKYKFLKGWHDRISYTDENGQELSYQPYQSNFLLPEFGLELKYGIDDINFPSFWSERITASALWSSMKMGIILPTGGYSSILKDVFEQERTLTNGGVGISGEMDFPVALLKNTGVFHLSAAYVFGDAKEADYKNRPKNPLDIENDPSLYEGVDFFDYLVRANATLHYTFGIAIDANYWLRFHLGASYYNIEHWYNSIVTDPITEEKKFKYVLSKDESIGGISGRLEFMATNVTTPFGMTMSYFDEALGAGLWMQIPVVENTFALKLEAKGYFTLFRDNLHNWERENVFIPMLRFLVYF